MKDDDVKDMLFFAWSAVAVFAIADIVLAVMVGAMFYMAFIN